MLIKQPRGQTGVARLEGVRLIWWSKPVKAQGANIFWGTTIPTCHVIDFECLGVINRVGVFHVHGITALTPLPKMNRDSKDALLIILRQALEKKTAIRVHPLEIGAVDWEGSAHT